MRHCTKLRLAAGARGIREPHDIFWGGHIAYAADPDGHVWEFAWKPVLAAWNPQASFSGEAPRGRANRVMNLLRKLLKISKRLFMSNSEDSQIEGLRVVVWQNDDGWMAQGLEIDYAAGGVSIEDVMERFSTGKNCIRR